MRFITSFLLLVWALSLQAQEAPRQNGWPATCQPVTIRSAKDSSLQRAYFHRSAKPGPQPLVVSLHSWSGGYDQQDELLPQVLAEDYHYIHPDFRGPNTNPAAGGSDLVLADLDDAVDYAMRHANVDPTQIHVVGNSGGGYATLLMYMRSRHRLASCSAFVPISNLESWYYESLGRRQKYYRDLLAVTASPDSLHFNGAEARRRSPLFMTTPLATRRHTQLRLAAGVHDGYTGSVPITHTIHMFNKLVRDFGGRPADQVSLHRALQLVTARRGTDQPKARFGDRQLIYQKRYGPLELVIFEGSHEYVQTEALAQIKPGYRQARATTNNAPPPNRQPKALELKRWQTDDFALPLSQIVSAPNQQWVNSGYTTVRPALHTVCGVRDFVSPPLVANGFSMTVRFTANGHSFSDSGEFWGQNSIYSKGTWQPDQITRHGTYHRMQGGRLVSMGFTSELVPLFGKAGFALKLQVENRTDSVLTLSAAPIVNPGTLLNVPLNEWGFATPGGKATVRQVSATEWATDAARLRLYPSDSSAVQLAPRQNHTYYWAVTLTPAIDSLPPLLDVTQLIRQTREAWQRRLDTYLAAVPKLQSTIPGLVDYYQRSLISGLVCIWENPAFVTNPYISTCGMDGGGINCYLWDMGYVPNMLALMLGKQAETLAKLLAGVKLDTYYSVTPAGSGIGVPYSYSTYAFTNLMRTLANHRGINPVLFAEAKRLILAQEARPTWRGLIDFGDQHNLLEMRNRGYEHYVPSPNIERAWYLRALADLNDAQGLNPADSRAWRGRADSITQAVRRELWDDRLGWFVCRSPDRPDHPETVYSIQIFDALAMGACTPAMKKRMLSQLQDGTFLFPYGVSSVSAKDSLRYEYNDTDWGGSGAYTGDGPQLAQMLYGEQQPDRAFDVLRRSFWLGQHLPYFPQEHYVDKPGVPAHKRANIVAGLTGAETILFYMVGLEPRLDGSLWLHPQAPASGSLTLPEVPWGGRRFSLQLSRRLCRIEQNGKVVYEGVPKLIRLIPPTR